MDPATGAMIASTVASLGSSIMGSRSQSKAQKRANKRSDQFYDQRQSLINELLSSIGGGGGRFSDLFSTDEDAFKRSFLDPAKAMFKGQIVPQIQQGSIAGGMQRSSSLDDQLMRAGVDLDQMLNQNYAAFQGQGQDRASSMISNILGLAAPQSQTAPQSTGSLMGQGAAGLFSSQGGQAGMSGLFDTLFSSTKSAGELTGGQKNILNNPGLMGLDASNSPRSGFRP